MAWIKTVSENEAAGELKAIYDASLKLYGSVPNIRKALALLFLSLVCWTSPLHAQAACQEQPRMVKEGTGERLDAFLADAASKGFSGAVLVAKDGEVILEKGYGFADRALRIPNTPDTAFNICSMSKIFTAAAVLRLEMQGKLSTQDPLSKHLGPFPGEKKPATIHHLLTHTAGLVQDGATLDSGSRESFICSMKDTPMESVAGEKYRYTNAGYSLLAAIIEEVSGQNFQSYLRENLFKPAGMMCTGFVDEHPTEGQQRAQGYARGPAEQAEPAAVGPYTWGTLGAGGIVSTVGDLYKWELALRSATVLSPAAQKKAFTPHVQREGTAEGYGWNVQKSSRGTTLYHRGCGTPGFEGEFLRFVDEDVVVIFAINNRNRWRVPIWQGIERILFEEGKAQ